MMAPDPPATRNANAPVSRIELVVRETQTDSRTIWTECVESQTDSRSYPAKGTDAPVLVVPQFVDPKTQTNREIQMVVPLIDIGAEPLPELPIPNPAVQSPNEPKERRGSVKAVFKFAILAILVTHWILHFLQLLLGKLDDAIDRQRRKLEQNPETLD
jgi:hypothetical protein